MYIIGETIGENKLKMVYAVFKDKKSADIYIEKQKVKLEAVVVDADYPFVLIEEFNNGRNSYKYITKTELENRIRQIETGKAIYGVYFNLWRIDEDMYNENFPSKPVLNGMHFHIHFNDDDLNQIEKKGFEAYWEDIITI